MESRVGRYFYFKDNGLLFQCYGATYTPSLEYAQRIWDKCTRQYIIPFWLSNSRILAIIKTG